MKTVELEDGDKRIFYEFKVLENGNRKMTDKPKKCVMCGKTAFFIARETKEALCLTDFHNNREARIKK